VLVPSSVVGELERLVRDSTPGAVAARALADRFERAEIVARGDSGVVEAAERLRAWVVTADRALQARLVRRGITVLGPRDRSRLEVLPGAPSPTSTSLRRPPSRRPRGNS
jgi:rRNA-processing protein FCF1